MTPEQITEARKIIEAAARGPATPAANLITSEADLIFYRAARTGWPKALDEIERLTRSQCEYDMDMIDLEKENASLREDNLYLRKTINILVADLKEIQKVHADELLKLVAQTRILGEML